MMTSPSPRGFTLLIAIILTSVLLAVGLSLLDTATKQLILASTAKQSEIAFYIADSALECALYHDQQLGSFSYSAPAASVVCGGQTLALTTSATASVRTTTFTIPCSGGGAGTQAGVTVYKQPSGQTALYATGYSSCSTSDPRRVERGLKVTY